MTELKTTPQGFNSRINEAEERISLLKDKAVALTNQSRKKKKRMK